MQFSMNISVVGAQTKGERTDFLVCAFALKCSSNVERQISAHSVVFVIRVNDKVTSMMS